MLDRTHLRGLAGLWVVASWLVAASGAQAVPMVVEPGWDLVRTVSFLDPNAAHYNPVDGKLYVVKVASESNGGGLYRIEDDGSATLLVPETRPRGIAIDPWTGDVFFSTGGNEAIYRVPFGTTTKQNWVTGFASGDDDPIGMAIVPDDWMGNILVPDGIGGEIALAPGMALVADEGNSGPDRVWAWFVGSAEGEQIVHDDTAANPSPLLAGVDVAFTKFDAWIADLAGFVYKINADGSLSVLLTSSPLSSPSAIAADPLTGQLYVLDQGLDQLLRVDPVTGQVTVVIEGFTVGDAITDTAGLDVSPDGRSLFVTDRGSDAIYVFQLVPEPVVSVLLAAGLGGLVWFGRRREADAAAQG